MPKKQLDVVLILKPECLTCKTLSPGLGKKGFGCKKDPTCTARFYNIALGVDLLHTARELAHATYNKDVVSMSTILGNISKLHSAVKDKILTLAKSYEKDL